MTLREKLGVLYARFDCSHRNCDNCAAQPTCNNTNVISLIHEIQTELKSLIKERDELLKKEEAK